MTNHEDPTLPRAAIVLELLEAARIVGDLSRDLHKQEMRLRSLAELAGTPEPMSLHTITISMRAHAGHTSDRAVALHDVARRLEALQPPKPEAG